MSMDFGTAAARPRLVAWYACVAVLILHSLLWGLRLLPDGAFRAIMSVERLLFLQGPPLALAQRTWPFFALYAVGILSCMFVLRRAILATAWLRTALLLAFAFLWCVWGVLASAPII